MRRLLLAIALPLLGLFPVAAQEASPELEALSNSFWGRLDGLTEEALQRHATLVDGYLTALERETGDASTGELARREIERIRARQFGESALASAPSGSKLAALRETFATEYGKLRDGFAKDAEQTTETYRAALEQLLGKGAVSDLAVRKALAELAGSAGGGLPGSDEPGAFYLSFDRPPLGSERWQVGGVRIRTIGSPELVEGVRGQAIRFPKRTDYLDLEGFQFHEAFTIACWVRIESRNMWSNILKASDTGEGPNMIRLAKLFTTERIVFELNSSGRLVTRGSAITYGEWLHLAVTYESGDRMRIYANGEVIAENRQINAMPAPPTKWVRIGQGIGAGGGIQPAGNVGQLNGCLDDFLYLPRSATEEEVAQIYEQSGGK